MEIKTIEEINQYIGTTVNPLDNPDTVYELYSVPSFESQHPEIIKGEDIGSSKITVEDGDVLVCKINPRINRVWVVKRHTSYPLLASSEWIVIRNCDIDSDYLKWYFSSPTFRNLLVSQVAGIGGSLTRAQPKQVAKYPVPLVGKEEQRRIAATMDKVSDLIAKRRAQLDKLDLLVKARFVEMFGDVETNPMNWPTSTIGAVVDSIEAGWSGNGAQRERQPGEIAVLKVSAVTKGYFIPSECKVLDDQKNIKKYVFPQKGDLLFSRANTKEMVGATAIIREDYPELILPDKLWKIRFSDVTNVVFMKYILSSKAIRNKFSEASTGTSGSMYNVSMEKFKAIQIPMPEISIQNQFASFVESVEKSKLMIQQSLDKLEILKKALMQQYFGVLQ